MLYSSAYKLDGVNIINFKLNILDLYIFQFAEHVLTDNDFMFDSSKRAIRASRHIIGQVLVDNSGKCCIFSVYLY